MERVKKARRLNTSRKKGATQRKSCDTCHRSKTKCDRKRPTCSTCAIFNRRCTYKHRDEHGAPEIQQVSISDDDIAIFKKPDLETLSFRHDVSTENETTSQQQSSNAKLSRQYATPSMSRTSSDAEPALTSPPDQDLLFPLDTTVPFASGCGYCLQPDCSECQSLTASGSEDMDGILISHRLPDLGGMTAQTILGAMASGTDEESSTILAAVRMGTPWETICNAIISDTYATTGLAQALQVASPHVHTTSTASGSPERMEEGNSEHYHPNRKIFDSLRYSPHREHAEDPKEFTGTMSHKRRVFKATSRPPLMRHSSRSKAGNDADSDLKLPVWSVLPMRMATDTDDPFRDAYNKMLKELATGIDVATFCGEHAYLGTIVNPKSVKKAPGLSVILAEMVLSIMPYEETPSVTVLAIYWLWWALWAWMLAPSPESFKRLPKLMRPTPWQLFSPHTLMYDFPLSAALRDYLCRKPRENNDWVTEAASTIRCSWHKTALHALTRHPVTKALDLSVECKKFASVAENWSFGPSVRAHLPDVDKYITIRSPQDA